MKYKILIVEELKRIVEVDAASEEAATDIVRKKWYDSEIILDSEDFVNVEFYTKEEF